jgi:hypothetical protein
LTAATAPTFIPQAQQAADLHNIIEQHPYDQLFGLSLAQALQCSAATSPLIMSGPLATAMAHLQQQNHLNGLINAVASVPNAVPLLPQVASGNPPCSTLFVANLGHNVNEEEVKQLFKSQPGYSRLRMHHKTGPGAGNANSGSVCFVEFVSVSSLCKRRPTYPTLLGSTCKHDLHEPARLPIVESKLR